MCYDTFQKAIFLTFFSRFKDSKKLPSRGAWTILMPVILNIGPNYRAIFVGNNLEGILENISNTI